MIIRYVSTTGSDSNDGASIGTAWATLSKWDSEVAALVAVDSVTLYVMPGTYTGVDAGFVRQVSGTSDRTITVAGHPAYDTKPVIDGTGIRCCYSLWGRAYWTLKHLAFRNIGGLAAGWSVAEGVSIRDYANTPGVGNNAHHCRITDCDFLQFERFNAAFRSAMPIFVGSFADERLGQEGTHDIEVDNCVFHQSKSDMLDGGGATLFAVSQVVVGGNTYDFVIRDCVFNHDMTVYMEGNGGIEFVANYNQSPGNYLTYPDQPRRAVIRRNQFIYTGPYASPLGLLSARYAIYPQGCADILIEQNITRNWPLGVGLVAEDGALAHNTVERIWVRNNLFVEPEQYALVAGTWSDGYLSPVDVWCTNNTIYRSFLLANNFPPITIVKRNTTSSPDGLLGEYGFYNNIVAAPDSVFMTEKVIPASALNFTLWVTDGATPFRYYDYATQFAQLPAGWNVDGFKQAMSVPLFSDATQFKLTAAAFAVGRGEVKVPSWYVAGMFGPYELESEYDVYWNGVNYSADRDIGAVVYQALHSQGLTGTLQRLDALVAQEVLHVL